MSRPELIEHHQAEDPVVRATLREELESLFVSKTRNGWSEELSDKETMVSPIRSPEEALSNAQIRDRDLVLDGNPPRIGFPAHFDDSPKTDEHVPELGEDTRSVLREIGYDDGSSLDDAS